MSESEPFPQRGRGNMSESEPFPLRGEKNISAWQISPIFQQARQCEQSILRCI